MRRWKYVWYRQWKSRGKFHRPFHINTSLNIMITMCGRYIRFDKDSPEMGWESGPQCKSCRKIMEKKHETERKESHY